RRFILERYVDVLVGDRAAPASDAIGEAFRIAETARSGSVQQAIAASAARVASGSPDLARLVRQEQDLKQQAAARNAVLANALSLPAAERNDTAVAATRADVDRLSAARRAIDEEIGRRFPDYAALTAPRAPTIKEARTRLRADEALVAMYANSDKVFVWAIPKQGPVAFAAVPVASGRLAAEGDA